MLPRCRLFYTRNNNLSQKFAAKDISNGSLDQITTTGFYFGSNITEVTPYIKSHKWCLINAFVSGNSANIFVAAGDAMALSIYRNGDGVYSYYPIATKSDLIQDGIYDATTDSNGVVAINSVVAGVTVDRFAGAYFYNDAVEANVLTRIHLYKKNVYAIAINPDSNKKYANTAMKIHVWYRKS